MRGSPERKEGPPLGWLLRKSCRHSGRVHYFTNDLGSRVSAHSKHLSWAAREGEGKCRVHCREVACGRRARAQHGFSGCQAVLGAPARSASRLDLRCGMVSLQHLLLCKIPLLAALRQEQKGSSGIPTDPSVLPRGLSLQALPAEGSQWKGGFAASLHIRSLACSL